MRPDTISSSPLQIDTMHKVTPVEINTNILNTIYQFLPRSRLKRFFIRKTGNKRTYYSLREILISLKEIIKEEEMFDQSNPSIIICSSEFERALGVKALHVTEIRDLVLSQLTKVRDQALEGNSIQVGKTSGSPTNIPRTTTDQNGQQTQKQPALYPKTIKSTNISVTTYTNKNTRFTVRPNMLKVLRLVPGVDNKKTVFSYEEITQLLSKYILSRKDDIFDPRNIKLAFVANDPIGIAFGVRTFHRCQINDLLRHQLIPFSSDHPPNLTVITHNSVSSEWNISFTEKHTLDSETYKPKNN